MVLNQSFVKHVKYSHCIVIGLKILAWWKWKIIGCYSYHMNTELIYLVIKLIQYYQSVGDWGMDDGGHNLFLVIIIHCITFYITTVMIVIH